MYPDTVVLRLALCASVYSYPLGYCSCLDKNSSTAAFIVVGVL